MYRSLAILGCFLSMAAGSVVAAEAYHFGTVRSLLVQEGRFGDCMALISPSPDSSLATCKTDWVTFSCSGDFNSRSGGQNKFNQAQLAMVTGNRVLVVIEDTKLHNGYCWANRIDVLSK